MNFTPFGVPFSGSLPITQFTANGKMTTQSLGGQVVGVLQGGEGGVHYLRPVDTSGTSGNNAGIPQTLITLPITMPGAKPGDPQQTVQIQVITGQPQPKYQVAQLPIQAFQQPGGGTVLTVAYNGGQQDGVLLTDGTQGLPEGVTVVAALQPHDLQLLSGATLQAAPSQSEGEDGEKTDDSSKQEGPQPVALVKADLIKTEMSQEPEQQYVTGIADYLSRVQTNSLPLSLNQFLKFNPETIKRESQIESSPLSSGGADGSIGDESNSLVVNMEQEGEQVNADGTTKKKKKYKKKPPKPKKPKPGQVHIATALDGTTLFCCPECNMAYPEKDLLEQHLVGHKIERRFICDICGAGLKRKEHLERHKLGHNPERPFICSVCMKGFKRKEHLNLHFVIHSGEKTEVCGECGKGFYRKDHLRKHARSHVARRVKEELSQQVQQAAAMAQAVQAAQQSQAQGQTQTQHLTIQVSNEAMEAMGLSGSNVPTTQIQVPVQIQVPPHLVANSISNTINNTISSALNSPMNTPNGNGSNMSDSTNDEQTDQQHQVSTVVLPTAAETGAMALLHQQQTNAHH